MHHHRRKSGNTSMTDVRKATVGASDPNYRKHSSRPSTMTRRITPQSAPKLGRSRDDRERELDDERWWDEERESFPQYCMVCEKQFIPADDQNLYCSETCRYDDQVSASTAPSRGSHPPTQYPFYSGAPEPRDIVPRASPSRPSSTHFSPPSTAVNALKSSLYIRPPSPTSPMMGTSHSGVWSFGRSHATSPDNSYTKPTSSYFSTTYDGAYYDHYGSSVDRPLPSRRPGVYSRPKSIELVTPMLASGR
ncbi:hypothetical protein QBC41DRAFT_108171 [Cercophora samala]|uniref:Uncharacterized protein n=1 Tax=Cercophora samala TaxID=330535 RepID=A0AA39ZEK2_9PEZI|nr:hypothetical protein QBC41DRAFT_108171 [Cercophora samala]